MSRLIVRVLVTGGAGFIGSHLVERLLSEGHEVIVLDDLSSGSLRNLSKVRKDILFVKGDVRCSRDVERAIRGTDCVVHLAALISVEESFRKPLTYNEVNVTGTLVLLKASEHFGVDKFVLISSCAVYGDPLEVPIKEDHPLRPLSPYAVSKVAAEGYTRTFEGLRPVILRLFNVYGPRQSPAYAGVITKFAERMLRGDPPIIYGDGKQTRDFVHVSDVVQAIMLSLEMKEAGTLNVGTGEEISVNELCEVMMEIMHFSERPIYGPARRGDIRRSCADISRAREVLGYEPKIQLKDGLRDLLATLRQNDSNDPKNSPTLRAGE